MAATHELARTYDVSNLTAAIRFTELSPAPCAAVFSARGKVAWCAPSASFPAKIGRGRKLAPESLAWSYFERGRLDEPMRSVPARAWLGAKAQGEIIEHAISSDEHGTVLSLLVVPDERTHATRSRPTDRSPG
jgi:hypothetical protein